MGKKTIEFGELRISKLAKKHIKDCIKRDWVSIGPKTKLFEEKWQNLFGYNHTVMVNSGTSADTAACMALYEYASLRQGDYIICPALSFIATANSIRAAGFEPLFIDVDKETLNIDVSQIEGAIEKYGSKVGAIMSVNLMGKPCRLDIIQDICRKHGLIHIVDNCEAYGSKIKGKYSLEYADMETTSHYIAHIICCGEGGTVSTNSKSLANQIKSIRSHGRYPGSADFDHIRYGLNLKPTDLCASIGLGEIDTFHEIFKKRKKTLYKFSEATQEFKDMAYFVEEDEDAVNAPHGFSITLKPKYKDQIQKLKKYLTKVNIHWKKNFGSMKEHKAFDNYGEKYGDCSNAIYIGNYGIHIGCHYWLSKADKDYVCHHLKKGLSKLQ